MTVYKRLKDTANDGGAKLADTLLVAQKKPRREASVLAMVDKIEADPVNHLKELDELISQLRTDFPNTWKQTFEVQLPHAYQFWSHQKDKL